MNLQSSTLKNDETDEAFHVQQAAQIRAYRAAWKEAGHTREPRVSVRGDSSRGNARARAIDGVFPPRSPWTLNVRVKNSCRRMPARPSGLEGRRRFSVLAAVLSGTSAI
jgi:hypothetical protein